MPNHGAGFEHRRTLCLKMRHTVNRAVLFMTGRTQYPAFNRLLHFSISSRYCCRTIQVVMSSLSILSLFVVRCVTAAINVIVLCFASLNFRLSFQRNKCSVFLSCFLKHKMSAAPDCLIKVRAVTPIQNQAQAVTPIQHQARAVTPIQH